MVGFLEATLISFIICIFVAIVTFVTWKIYIRKWSHLPIAKGCLPIIGHIYKIKGTSFDEFINWLYFYAEENGPTFVFFFLWKPVLFTKDVNIGKTLLSSQKYITRTPQIKIFGEVFGNGLLTGKGKIWKERRHLVTPAFHLEILSNNIPIIENQAQLLVQRIKELQQEDGAVKFVENCRDFALGTICEFAMGIPMRLCKKNPEKSTKMFSDASQQLIITLNARLSNPLYNLYFSFTEKGKMFRNSHKIFDAFIKSVVEERISMGNSSPNQQRVFIDIMFEAYQNKKISVDGMLDEIKTFIFGGNETIAFSLTWVIYYLGKLPVIQEKLFNELIGFKERNIPVKEVIKEAIYFDCVIKEILRITTIGSFARYMEEDAELNGLSIPKGTGVTLLAQNIHLDKTNWPNPEEIRPERFQEEGPEEYNFKYLPFSAGPRNCIGKRMALAELKIAVYYLVLNFKFSVSKDFKSETKSFLKAFDTQRYRIRVYTKKFIERK